jgi:thiol-disulfide isomerase/thioredoxin
VDRERATFLGVSLIAAVAGVLLFRFTLYQPEFNSAGPTDSGPAAGDASLSYQQIILHDLNNRPRALSEWNKPLQIINLWAPWCAPCRREIPALVELQQTYADELQIIGLSFDSKPNVVKFREDMTINYPLLMVQSESTQINRFFGNDNGGLPFTAILNAEREIVYRHSGEISKQELEKHIKTLL